MTFVDEDPPKPVAVEHLLCVAQEIRPVNEICTYEHDRRRIDLSGRRSMLSMPAFFALSTKSLMSARNGTTTVVTPVPSRHAGAVKSRLFPPPVGITTTSGRRQPSTIVSSASFCVSERNETSTLPRAFCIAL
jgi:hypothetical protein